MRKDHIWLQRIAARIQGFSLVTALALMLGFAGWLLGGAEMALAAFFAVVGLYWLQPLMAPHLILRVRGGRPLLPQQAPVLHRMVQDLARQARLERTPRLYFLPGDVMNAFTAGSGRHAVVGVTHALLRHLNRDEVAGVLAHEIAHIRNQDTRVMGFAALLSQLIQGMSLVGQLLLILNLPLILAGHKTIDLGGILLLILMPYAGLLIQLALSRSREYLADLEAAALVGSPQPLASALIKIERHNHGIRRFHFGWPGFKPGGPSLLRTHPPTRERIRRLLEIQEEPRLPPRHPVRTASGPTVFGRLVTRPRIAPCQLHGLCP